MNPTPEQQVALDTVVNGKNLKLNAFAGAGKTSTLIMMAEVLGDKRGIYLAFNKGIASEAQAKMPRNVVARTFHSMAYSAMPNWMAERFRATPMHINDFCKRFSLKGITYTASVDTYHKNTETGSSIINMNQVKKISGYKMKRLVDLSLVNFMSSTEKQPRSGHVWAAIDGDLPELRKENPDVFERLVLDITPIIQYLWADFSSPEGQIAIGNNHNVYFKYWTMTNPVINYDFILFDEAQDADPLMLEVLKHQNAQVIYVGDKHQQIYGWRGAVNALERINANELYLTQSFRFGQSLADQCKPILRVLSENQVFKGMDFHTEVSTEVVGNIKEYAKYNACLCRTNAEVVMTVLELAAGNVACNTNIDSKSIVKTLEDMKQLQDNTKHIDLSVMDVPIYETEHKKIKFHSWEELVIYMNDFNTDPELAITFDIFMNYGLNEITNALRVAKNKDGVVVTTAHKAKGLEWDSIILQGDFLKGFFEMNQGEIKYKAIEDCNIYDNDFWVKNGGSLKDIVPVIRTGKGALAELRLLYVAVTRAKKKANISMVNKIFLEFFKLHNALAAWTDVEDED